MQMNTLFSQELLEDVNGTVYTASEPEVLDDFMIDEASVSVQPNSGSNPLNNGQTESISGWGNASNNNGLSSSVPVNNMVSNTANNVGLSSEVLSNEVLSNQPLMDGLNNNSLNNNSDSNIKTVENNIKTTNKNSPIFYID